MSQCFFQGKGLRKKGIRVDAGSRSPGCLSLKTRPFERHTHRFPCLLPDLVMKLPMIRSSKSPAATELRVQDLGGSGKEI